MRKTILSLALLTSLTLPAFSSEQIDNDFKGNWRKTFVLISGATVTHTPQYTALGNGIRGGTGINFKSKTLDGYPMSEYGLCLATNSTEKEFEEALVKSGLYKKK